MKRMNNTLTLFILKYWVHVIYAFISHYFISKLSHCKLLGELKHNYENA